MIPWKPLEAPSQLDHLVERSREVPCLIFKHSTRCALSSVAKSRLETSWDFDAHEVEPFFLDILSYRDLARTIADTFQVHHESPQLLLIRSGECTYDASHLDISVKELRECFEDTW